MSVDMLSCVMVIIIIHKSSCLSHALIKVGVQYSFKIVKVGGGLHRDKVPVDVPEDWSVGKVRHLSGMCLVLFPY